MKIKIEGEYYSLTQCLMAIWVFLDDWRRYLKAMPKEDKKALVGNIAFWTFTVIVGAMAVYAFCYVMIILN